MGARSTFVIAIREQILDVILNNYFISTKIKKLACALRILYVSSSL